MGQEKPKAPEAVKVNLKTLRSLIKNNVRENPESGCWEWVGTTTSGYGVIVVDGQRRLARRLAYLAWGRLPPAGGSTVRVSCKNRCCVNPNHLTVGRAKGGVHEGHRGPQAKHPWDVWFDRALYGEVTLRRGKDYSGLSHGMAQQARGAAFERDLRLTIQVQSEFITLRATR